MALAWTDHQIAIAEAILKHRTDTESGYDMAAVKLELPPGVSKGRISEVAKALRANNWVIPEKSEPKSLPASKGGPLAAIGAQVPAPVVFRLGKQEVEVDVEPLYESHLLFLDLKAHCDIKSSFSETIRDGIALLWQILATEPVIEKGQIKLGVSNGGSPRSSKEETGVGATPKH